MLLWPVSFSRGEGWMSALGASRHQALSPALSLTEGRTCRARGGADLQAGTPGGPGHSERGDPSAAGGCSRGRGSHWACRRGRQGLGGRARQPQPSAPCPRRRRGRLRARAEGACAPEAGRLTRLRRGPRVPRGPREGAQGEREAPRPGGASQKWCSAPKWVKDTPRRLAGPESKDEKVATAAQRAAGWPPPLGGQRGQRG